MEDSNNPFYSGYRPSIAREHKAFIDKPIPLYDMTLDRGKYRRRLFWALLSLIAGVLTLYMFTLPNVRAASGYGLYPWGELIGRLAGAGLILLGAARAAYNLVLWLALRGQRAVFYDRGFAWQVGKQMHKYAWRDLRNFQQLNGGWYTRRGRPILQYGSLRLTMADGKTFTLRPAHGNLRLFLERVGPTIGDATGALINRYVRAEKPYHVHQQLIVWPGGLQVGKQEIRWADLRLNARRDHLQIFKRGRRRPIRTFALRRLNNPQGLMDFATGMMELYGRDVSSRAAGR